MTPSHLHLILNHVPTVGSVGALGLLLLGFARKNEQLKQAALEVLCVIAILTLPVYISGVAAHRELRDLPELSDTAVRAHQDAALYGFAGIELAAGVAWMALWQARRRGQAARGLIPAVALLLLLALAIMGRAANLGGEIRHPEIGAGVAAGTAAGGTEQPEFLVSAISQYLVQESRWAWPIAESVHFLGMSLSMGVLLAVNLRILGAMRRVPFGELHRLLVWGMLGFGANLITGMLFVVSQPGQYVQSTVFHSKVVFLMIAGANFLYLTVFSKWWTSDRLEASLSDKAIAVASLFSWFAVLYTGRMLPFLGNAF